MTELLPEFRGFQKIARLSRDIVITEKIDGTNGVIYIPEVGGLEKVMAGSKSRWLTLDKKGDNFGFAAWVELHREELVTGLGPGYHYGEWWGQGIQRGYGLDHKRFSVFNPYRYTALPPCVYTVPVLYEGPFSEDAIKTALREITWHGSKAVPDFMNPEGIVIYHTASKTLFKKTIHGDEKPKGSAE